MQIVDSLVSRRQDPPSKFAWCLWGLLLMLVGQWQASQHSKDASDQSLRVLFPHTQITTWKLWTKMHTHPPPLASLLLLSLLLLVTPSWIEAASGLRPGSQSPARPFTAVASASGGSTRAVASAAHGGAAQPPTTSRARNESTAASGSKPDCGVLAKGATCGAGKCCSYWNFCGTTMDHCLISRGCRVGGWWTAAVPELCLLVLLA